MARKLITPVVREILPLQPETGAPRDERRHRTSQRALVAASLISARGKRAPGPPTAEPHRQSGTATTRPRTSPRSSRP